MQKISRFIRTKFEKDYSERTLLLLSFVLLLIIFSPALIFGKISLNGDVVTYAYPSFHFLKYHAGEMLNSLTFGGYPVSVAFHIGVFNPIYRIFADLFDYVFAYHLIIFIDYLAGFLFTYYFVKGLGRSVHASLAAACIFIFSQWGFFWMSANNITHAMYLLPGLFLVVQKISEKKWNYFLLGGLLIGLNLTYAHYQFVLMAILFAVCYMLYTTRNAKPLAFFGGAGILGLIIGSQQLLRTFHFLPLTMRAASANYTQVWYYDAIRYFIPSFTLPGSVQEFLPYIGIIPLFLVVVCLLRVRKEEWGKHGKFFLWSWIILTLLFFKYSPLFYLFTKIPVLGHYFIQTARFIYLDNFALAILAAIGFDYLVKNPERISQRLLGIHTKIVIWIAGLFVLGNLLYLVLRSKLLSIAFNYFDAHKYAQTIGLPKEYYHGLMQVMADKLFNNVSLLNVDVLAGLVFLASIVPLMKTVYSKKLFSNLCLFLIAANLLIVGMTSHSFGSRKILEDKPRFASVIESLEPEPYTYRTLSYMIPFAQYQMLQALHPDAKEEGFIFSREALVGNLNYFSNMPIAGGYEPLAWRRYQSLLFVLEAVPKDVSDKGRNDDIAEKINLMSIMNIRYLITPYPVTNDHLKLIEKEEVTSYKLPLYLYQNISALPIVYFPKNIEFVKEGDIDSNFQKIVTGLTSDIKTFIECNDCIDAAAAKGTIANLSISAAKTSFDATIETPGWLIVAHSNVPTWKATIDGKETRIYFANHAFQAIKVSQGEHSVSFSYSPVI